MPLSVLCVENKNDSGFYSTTLIRTKHNNIRYMLTVVIYEKQHKPT